MSPVERLISCELSTEAAEKMVAQAVRLIVPGGEPIAGNLLEGHKKVEFLLPEGGVGVLRHNPKPYGGGPYYEEIELFKKKSNEKPVIIGLGEEISEDQETFWKAWLIFMRGKKETWEYDPIKFQCPPKFVIKTLARLGLQTAV